MGKNTDKMYMKNSEWTSEFGGKKRTTYTSNSSDERLPFTHCSLSLQAWLKPVCTRQGHIFEESNILAFLKKFGKNPITGKKLDQSELISLNFSKNGEGDYCCPVTFQNFTPHSMISAIATTGNVYLQKTIQELNLSNKNYFDLITEEPFNPSTDIILLQDPLNERKLPSRSEWYLNKTPFKLPGEIQIEEEKAQPKTSAQMIMQKLNNNKNSDNSGSIERSTTLSFVDSKKKVDPFAAHYSTGKMAASFTSTSMNLTTKQESARLDVETVLFDKMKQVKSVKGDEGKGYVNLITNHGEITLELLCQKAPKTCFNFLKLCQSGYYDGTQFHRLIKHFMIQGGDPTGSGKGGESIWKKPFADEICDSLHHDTRGILSMANRGKNTNSSQFFITFKPCSHLDGKHTIFGRVIGDFSALGRIESQVETDESDRPLVPVGIIRAKVVSDPFVKLLEKLESNLLATSEQQPRKKRKETPVKIEESSSKQSKVEASRIAPIGKYLKIKK